MQSDDGRVPSPLSLLEDTGKLAVMESSLSMGAAITDVLGSQTSLIAVTFFMVDGTRRLAIRPFGSSGCELESSRELLSAMCWVLASMRSLFWVALFDSIVINCYNSFE